MHLQIRVHNLENETESSIAHAKWSFAVFQSHVCSERAGRNKLFQLHRVTSRLKFPISRNKPQLSLFPILLKSDQR